SVVLTDVQFSGSYTNGKTRALESSKILINNFSAGLKEGRIKVNFKMTNFVKPEVVLVTDSELDLGELQNFVKIDTIQVISGKLDIKASYKGKLSSIDNFTHNDFINSTTSGKMIIKNMDYQLAGDKNIYKNLNADISFNNNDLIVDTLSGNISGSDFSLQGYFKNFLSFIFIPEENLIIEAELHSRNVKLDKLLVSNSSETEGEYKLDFSDRLEFYLDFNIEKLTFEKFEAKNISGKLKIKERKLNVPYLSMQSEDGITQAKGFIDGTENNKLFIDCEATIRNVNVKKLFYEFGSFGQSGLTEKNISGTLNADVKFSGIWNPSLKVDPSSIYTKADIIIEDGALIDYPPIMELSEYIKDADLSNVKFSTLQNKIEIINEQIFIPDMEINSDAIDIFASGLHKFNNEINYHLRVLWSELKSKNYKDEENEFGIVIDDGLSKTTLFFVISGTLDNPIVKYDKKGVKDKIINDFIKEKQKIKEIFREEFNNKEEDPVRIKEKEILKKQEEGKFVIEWEEDEKDSLKEKTIIKKRNRPEVYIEWEDEDEDNDTIKMK
ncbi:MAG: AsmA-like C-terminal region-containing protein, partial [Bacteroidales bacterium]|nr:AsmA-like C-terminal region-containing protein [Bacteroidales bacterium]